MNWIAVILLGASLAFEFSFQFLQVSGRATVSGKAVIKTNGANPSFPGGFTELSTSTRVPTLLTPTDIAQFMPSGRGPFTFPAPYNTLGIRLTIPSDCSAVPDCVHYVGYSYWALMNNHVNDPYIYIALRFAVSVPSDSTVRLFKYDKTTDVVTDLGVMTNFPAAGNTEIMYFSHSLRTGLYIVSPNSKKLDRLDVETHVLTNVLDITSLVGTTYPSTTTSIWQAHSSFDDDVHSFTVRGTGCAQGCGCGVYRKSTNEFFYYPWPQPGIGSFDECQVDASGRWVLLKMSLDAICCNDNRIVDLSQSPPTTFDLLDPNGAGGHSDSGYGYAVMADNFAPANNAYRIWTWTNGNDPALAPIVYNETGSPGGLMHVSHLNALQGPSPSSQIAFGSSANASNVPHGNEIQAFKLNGSKQIMVIAPVMTDMNAAGDGAGAGGVDYNQFPKGNVDVTGKYFLWTTNLGGNRLDAMLVKVPNFP